MVIANIADHFISSEIQGLKQKATSVVQKLELSSESKWPEMLLTQRDIYPEFIGMTIFDLNHGPIVASGDFPAPHSIIDDKYIKQAFLGKKSFSSTYPLKDGVVFYLAVPFLEEYGRILVLTLPGMYFSQQLASFVIWETGHIFIDDSEGYIIANIRPQWINERFNFILMAEKDKQYEEMAVVIRRMIGGESGIGYFSVANVPRICAFMPIHGSEEGWCLGVIAPIPESPLRDIDNGLIIVGFVGFFLSVIAAIIGSNFVKKPYEEIAALKELAESNSMYKSNFLANMNHEMRTPLSVIVGLTDLRLEEMDLPVNIKEDLQKINSAGEILLGLVSDVLDISKIEAGMVELIPVDYNTASLLNDVITLNIIRIRSRPINFIVDISENLPRDLFGDELRIKQILNNLLSNAFKYTKTGKVTLRVECEQKDENDTWLSMTISDTGIGIRAEDIKKIFSNYNQVDTKANRKIEGTGLGLPIAKKLTELMDGEITVESEYGVGSSFHIRIRQGSLNDKTITKDIIENLRNFRYTEEKQNTSVGIVRIDMSYARVLVVDDYQTNLDVAAGMLRKYKMKVDCVTSGQAAIDLIKKENPIYNAIFMDHMMPEMDGIEATQIIRKLDSDYARNIPIISLTANALAGNEKKFLKKGFTAFLSKPINIMNLDSILRKWVRKKSHDEGEIHSELQQENSDTLQKESKNNEIEIPGVNTKAGLILVGGEMELYKFALESFAGTTSETIEKLRNVTKDNLHSYAIDVHSLKGVCATIGAEYASVRAKKLELMAKEGNLSGVLDENDEFLKDVEKILIEVKNWLNIPR